MSVRSMERNFSLSPTNMALLTMGSSDFSESSMGTGGTFSPPAVMISSVEEIELSFGMKNAACLTTFRVQH